MFLNNGKKVFKSTYMSGNNCTVKPMMGTNNTITVLSGIGTVIFKNTSTTISLDGIAVSARRTADSYTYARISGDSSNVYIGLCYGTDNTPVEESDYKLGNMITSLSRVNNIAISDYSNLLTDILSISSVVKNNTSEDITINEVGVYYKYPIVRNDENNTSYPVLISREVLDNPVILHPGNEYLFTVSLTL